MTRARLLCIVGESAVATRMADRFRALGYFVSVTGSSGAMGTVVQMSPDVILTDLTGQQHTEGTATAERAARELDVPLLFLCSEGSRGLLPQEVSPFAYLMEDAGDRELEMAVEIARYKQRIDRQLTESDRRLADVTSAFGEAVYMVNESGQLTFMNPEAEHLLGWTEAELMGKAIYGVIHVGKENKNELLLDEWTDYRSLATANRQYSDHEILRRRDGSTFLAAMVSTPVIKDGRAVASVTSFRDISGQKQAQEDLLNARKLEAIGILAGGIAHDFNNLLTAIIGNISFARMFVTPEDRIFDRLEAAEKAALQAKDLTYQLLVFAKGGESDRKTVSLGGLIRDSADFAASGSNVRCDVSIPDSLSPVEVDTSQLRQVVLNLVTNAKEAMSGGGTVTITAEDITLGPGSLPPLKEGTHVKISVRDHGTGIPPEYLSRIFDPYFSTKEMSARKGIGFGLAVCYSIVRNHGGLITAESEVGKGTVFHIYLPASPRTFAAQVTRRQLPLVGTGKVLVMDDEEIIRLVTGNMLNHIGFRVSLASNGEEAIEAYGKAMEKGEPFDIVILDLTVRGGMGGEETMRRLREMDPRAKAIVTSGYSRDPVMRDFAQHGFSAALPKPYKIQELFETLQSAFSLSKEPPSVLSGTEQEEEESE